MGKLTYSVDGIVQDGTRVLFGGMGYAPDDVVKKILHKQADVVMDALNRSAKQRLNIKGYSTGITSESFKKKNIKRDKNGNLYKDILPYGTRPNGANATKRNAAVAFYNEFGVPGKKIEARQFIRHAIDEVENELVAIAQEELMKFFE